MDVVPLADTPATAMAAEDLAAPAPVAVCECDTLVLAVDPGLRHIGLYAAAAKLDDALLPEETPLDVVLIDGQSADALASIVCARARDILVAVRPRNALVLYEAQTFSGPGGARIGGQNPDLCGRIVAGLLIAIELSGVPRDAVHSRGMRLASVRGATRPQLKALRRSIVCERRPAVWDMIVRAQPKPADQDHLCDAVCMVMQELARRRKERTTAARAEARASAKQAAGGGVRVRGRDTARPPVRGKKPIS